MNNKEKKNYFIVTFGIIALLVVCVISANLSENDTTNEKAISTTSSDATKSTSSSTKSSQNVGGKTNSTASTTVAPSKSSETETPKKKNDTKSVKSTAKKSSKKDKSIKLFEKIYVPYATRENVFLFSSVKAYVKASGFKCKITKPSKKDSGEIKVSNSNGDYVYFYFHSVDGLDLIMSVSYYCKKSDSEVSLSNYSSDNLARYDTLKTHVIGESNEDVDSVEEQREFLFSD